MGVFLSSITPIYSVVDSCLQEFTTKIVCEKGFQNFPPCLRGFSVSWYKG